MRILPILLTALLLAVPARPVASPAVISPEAAVRADFEALSAGDLDRLVGLFAEDIHMYRLPTDAHTLVGARVDQIRDRAGLRRHLEVPFANGDVARHEVIDMLSLGELVAVRVAIHAHEDAPADHALTVFRVSDGLIQSIWHVAKEAAAQPQSGAAAKAVIQQLAEANNRGDVDAFLALFAEDARNFHFRRDPERLGGGPSASVTDHASRQRVFREIFAQGAPVQVTTVASVALGEWVVAQDEAVKPDGSILDELSIYRVRDGRIIDDWYVAEQPRQ
ncbi:nuclear transport factor 2 family protein [Luteimonas suaedae]|uniref:nuclear transport factor 2 family protein n=1 Tax=Luteimonas suaedae TaxID=2605430 RepID=UPI0011EDCDC6|nr:nuclear transport factor 2 family protein [Luteimonas suaedae]